jgi:hypothetical protein
MHATKRRPQLRLGWQSAFAHRLASMPPTPGAHRVVLPSRGRQTLRLPRRPRSLQWRGRVEAQRDNEVLRCSPTSGAVQAAAARVVQRRTASSSDWVAGGLSVCVTVLGAEFTRGARASCASQACNVKTIRRPAHTFAQARW